MGLLSNVANIGTSLYANIQAGRLRERGEALALDSRLQPTTTTTGLGTGFIDPETGAARAELSPEFAQLRDMLLGISRGAFGGQEQQSLLGNQALTASGGFLEQIGADPYAAAEERFNRLDAILEPGRQRRRSALGNKLLR